MNRLQKLHQDLQATTKAKEVTNVHLANITGFSRPSISEAIRSGKINNRMNRVLDLVELVIGAYDITSLWALAEKEKEEISWEDFVVKKVNHCFSVSGVLEENQLDIVDVFGRPEMPEWLPLQLQGEAEKLSDDQLREVVMIGEISQQGAIGAFKELIKNSSEIDAKAEGKEKITVDSPAVSYKQLAPLDALECYTGSNYSYCFYKSWYHRDVKHYKKVQRLLPDGVHSAVFVESGKDTEVLYTVPTEPGRPCAEWVQEWLLEVIEEKGDLPDFLEWLKENSEVRLVVLPGTKNRALLGISTEQNLMA